jgi:TonB family protein
MKTKKESGSLVNIKVLIIIPVIVLSVIAIASCGRTKNNGTTFSEQVPPPPPSPVLSDSVFAKVDELPVFQGGNPELIKFISNNMKYPEEAKKKNIQGKVLVKFVVEKDCSVSKVEIAQSINALLDAEALRVVSLLPKFEKPGIQAGSPVRVQFYLPITFALN